MKWDDAKRIINSDPEVIKELDNNSVEYQIVKEIIKPDCLSGIVITIPKKPLAVLGIGSHYNECAY